MSETIKSVGLVLAGIVVGLLVAAVLNGGFTGGGVYSNVQKDFSQGISVDGTEVISGAGNVVAPITSTTGSFTGQLDVTEASGTSTTYVSATAASVGGRIILEDSDGAGCSEIYILNGTVISATVTCP